ncbi:hypothetical protein EDF57_103564 [Novosphingobium sp. PhB55]|uniref:hypothetical protein n=1 Tax=Novosphingobium sp. PhB55 TaxID=2485106 RepID=UPI0010657C65|nr:hypothetical protein [Novosphingobium sp. PhB55]TDW65380.1 hypothetical protein EDF57_103564 [Novosphingobium sp. PhB55]
MSHFTVLVITDEAPTEDKLSEILQPWHEFECTGTEDQYVKLVDETAEVRELMTDRGPAYEGGSDRPALTLYDALSYYGREERIYLTSATELSLEEAQEIMESDRESYKHGFAAVRAPSGHSGPPPSDDEEAFEAFVNSCSLVGSYNRTNPEKKWDWWVVGGRWGGMLRLKSGATGTLGRPGTFGRMRDEPGTADSAQLAAIDVEGMRSEARSRHGVRWDRVDSAMQGLPQIVSWDEIREQHKPDFDAARTAYRTQPGVEAIRKAFPDHFDIDEEVRASKMSRDDYVAAGAASALTTFAVVKDGKWFERGRMGWWAVVQDEKGEDAWDAEFAALLDGLPDTAHLTVVDCHI